MELVASALPPPRGWLRAITPQAESQCLFHPADPFDVDPSLSPQGGNSPLLGNALKPHHLIQFASLDSLDNACGAAHSKDDEGSSTTNVSSSLSAHSIPEGLRVTPIRAQIHPHTTDTNNGFGMSLTIGTAKNHYLRFPSDSEDRSTSNRYGLSVADVSKSACSFAADPHHSHGLTSPMNGNYELLGVSLVEEESR